MPPSTPLSAGSKTRDYSCLACKKRKVRCDRQDPCARCVREGVECVPGVRAPYPRRRLPLRSKSPGPEQADEATGPVQRPGKPPAPGPSFGQNLWHGMADQFSYPRAAETVVEDEDGDLGSARDSPFPDPVGLVFGAAARPEGSLAELHPSPKHAFMLWQTFLENINPLSKVVHGPSMQAEVVQAMQDPGATKRSSTALLFAIYAAAVVSMKDEACRSAFGESRHSLLAHYVSATQQALAAANFMRVVNFTLLQAFTIYLLTARKLYDPQTVWLLAGMAQRMGQRLGLHQEPGSSSQMSAFDVQMRRRVWWQIIFIDGRIGQLAGSQTLPPAGAYSFALPANLNDADINPGMTEAPAGHDRGATEMMFCMVRYELGAFLSANGQKLHSPAVSVADKDKLIDEYEARVECSYLRYCDPALPVHLLSLGGARSAICKMRLMAHHPCQHPDKGAASMSAAERDLVFRTSVKMVEYDVLGRSNRALDHLAWHMDVYFQLDAFIFMLIESQSQAPGPLVDKAWQLVSDTYRYLGPLWDDPGNELHAEVARLTLRAWRAREANLARHGLDPGPVPDVIPKLRSWLEEPSHARRGAVPTTTGPDGANSILDSAGASAGALSPGPSLASPDAGEESIAPSSGPLVSGPGQIEEDSTLAPPMLDGEDDMSAFAAMDWEQWTGLFDGSLQQQWIGTFERPQY